jgi:hypothetical protein
MSIVCNIIVCISIVCISIVCNIIVCISIVCISIVCISIVCMSIVCITWFSGLALDSYSATTKTKSCLRFQWKAGRRSESGESGGCEDELAERNEMS